MVIRSRHVHKPANRRLPVAVAVLATLAIAVTACSPVGVQILRYFIMSVAGDTLDESAAQMRDTRYQNRHVSASNIYLQGRRKVIDVLAEGLDDDDPKVQTYSRVGLEALRNEINQVLDR